MKSLFNLFSLIFILSILLVSCDRNEEEVEVEMPCTFEVEIIPICSFDPKTDQSVLFPVFVFRDSVIISQPEYEFIWNSDPNFSGSSIDITYEQLPLTVKVTEVSSDCMGEATIETSYWD